MPIQTIFLVICVLFQNSMEEGGDASDEVQYPKYYIGDQNKEMSFSDPKYFDQVVFPRKLGCNPLTKRIFGLEIDQDESAQFFTPSIPSAEVKSMCPKLSKTCCNSSEIRKYLSRYSQAITDFEKAMTIISNTLLIFKGNLIQNLASTKLKQMPKKCSHIFKNYKIRNGKRTDFFDIKEVSQNILDIYDGSAKMNWFIKTIKKIYGGLVCSLCSPENNHLILWNKSGPVFRLSLSMCAKIIELKMVIQNLFVVYKDFLHPLSLGLICLNDWENDNTFKLEEINYKEFLDEHQKETHCGFLFHSRNPNCIEVCKVDFFKFRLPKNFVKAYLEVSKVLWVEMTSGNMNAYYERTGINLNQLEMEEFEFTPLSEELVKKYNLKKIEYATMENGLNIFLQTLRFSRFVGLITTGIAILVFLQIQ